MENRTEAQNLAPGARVGAKYPLTVWPLYIPGLLHPATAPGLLLGTAEGGVHGNVRLSWLLFASANLKNALVFPFGLGSPRLSL